MKQLKQFLLTLVLLMTAAAGAWADGTVYTKPMALDQLQVDDILAQGFSLTGAGDVKFTSSRVKLNDQLFQRGTITLTLYDNVSYGEDCAIIASGGQLKITPADEDGNDGNAWKVTETVNNEGKYTVTIVGIKYTAASAVTPTANKNEWTMAMPASNVLLKVVYKDRTAMALTFGEQDIPAEGVKGFLGYEQEFIDALTAAVTNIENQQADPVAVTTTADDFTFESSDATVIAFQKGSDEPTASGALADIKFLGESTEPVTLTIKYKGTDDLESKTATLAVTVTEKTYSVSLADGTADATSWQGKKGDNGIYVDLPIEGLKSEEKVVLKYNGHRKVKEVKATTASAIPVKGKFTINADGDQVSFAPGNLQYQPSTNTWRFALHQWDVVGSGNASISETYAGWIDLFGWGTSGHKFSSGYGSAYQPWSTSTTDQDYGTTSPNLYPLAGNFAQGDWGTNMGDGWRTLVAGEWKYLFDTRKGNDDGDRFAKAKVNGVCGVILLPDDWSRDYYDLTSYNMTAVIFDANVISLSDWTDKLALHGAVFLPAAGSRDGTTVDGVGSYGYYWSATPQNANNGWTVHLASDIVERKYIPRHDGASVRLVKAAE